MNPPVRALIRLLSLLIFAVQESRSVCVNASTDLEQAVLGSTKKLTCILCMKREEITAETTVRWSYTPKGGPDNLTHHIYQYYGRPSELDGPLKGRVLWNGSKDLQDVSISIVNLTLNDSGVYTCEVKRTFFFNLYSPSISNTMKITLKVTEKGEDSTALYSEIMMYVLLVFLTLWLLVEMIYCYRKISKSDEQAQDSAY